MEYEARYLLECLYNSCLLTLKQACMIGRKPWVAHKLRQATKFSSEVVRKF